MSEPPAVEHGPIRMVVSDVDGTLVDSDKRLSPATIRSVRRLDDVGIVFAVASSRPTRGLQMLVDPLRITTPMVGFNGGLVVGDQLSVLDRHPIPTSIVAAIIGLLDDIGLDVWVYSGDDWLVRDVTGPHVEHESDVVGFSPESVSRLVDLAGSSDVERDVYKIVGVSDDSDLIVAGDRRVRSRFGDRLSVVRSQPYYLDISQAQATKGDAVRFLASRFGIALDAVATLGDMPTDTSMFAVSGMSIAMGNAHVDVQAAAGHVTATNDDDGFSEAIERHVLAAGSTAP